MGDLIDFKARRKVPFAELTSVPQPQMGVPFPIIVAYDWDTLVVYEAEGSPNIFPDLQPGGMSSHSQGPTVVLRFGHVYQHRFGQPDENTVAQHPLYRCGLDTYTAVEIFESPWLNEANDEALRHFFIAFHDSSFECLAKQLDVKVIWKPHEFETIAELMSEFTTPGWWEAKP
ncbi:hypothetical protein [Asticcacaulis sp. YBE204]|uniref:hypothetical protein n=1 Tax=Asticcacaulis sp. YBE204 TaxID=1282363 RepID=UPI0003C3D003|nr:hypothetical protein [Asticcacaulis sp. YBE204]ESQ78207.1 hypothetical protein AEYBE204_15330 [Asticcacaulis sp. YBE204]